MSVLQKFQLSNLIFLSQLRKKKQSQTFHQEKKFEKSVFLQDTDIII